jgi:hypothetical protein
MNPAGALSTGDIFQRQKRSFGSPKEMIGDIFIYTMQQPVN